MQKQKGITLVSLIITIIIMLILAGVSLSVLFDANGIIARGKLAAEKANIADYGETLDNIGTVLMIEKQEKGLSGKSYMDRYEEEIRKEAEGGSLDGSTVTRQNDETVRVVTKEGYVFDVTEKEVKYVGKQGETPAPPAIIETDLEFKTNPEEITNKDVVVTIVPKITIDENYTIQYVQKNLNEEPKEAEWKNYALGTEIKFTQKGNIFVRLINNLSETGKSFSHTVNNIDKEAPNTFEATAEPVTGNKSNSIIVKGHTTDKPETTQYACSGIKEYYFKQVGASDNSETIKQIKDWGDPVQPDGDNDVSKTFEGLTQGGTYYFVIKAVDNAGNETITEKVQASTDEVPGLDTADITFDVNPTKLTNEDVTVTINASKTYDGYTLQYAKKDKNQMPDEEDWEDYEIGTTIITLDHNGNVFARLKDSRGQGGSYITTATETVNNIDKQEPNTFTASADPVAGNKSNSIVVKGHTTDKPETTQYACSGIKEYYFKQVGASDNAETIKQIKDWGDPVLPNGDNDVSKTFEGLTQGGTYYFVIKAVDNAGNETITEKVSAGTETVPGLTTADITFTATPATWTKGNVTVTINLSKTFAGYTLQYAQKDKGQVPSDTDWTNCSSGQEVTLTKNGNVFARLIDNNKQEGTMIASQDISNIDTTLPEGDSSGITTTVTDTQIKANLNVTDAGGSGLAKVEWKYSVKNGGMGTLAETNNWSELYTDVSKPGETSKQASTTITGLIGNTEYDIKAIIYDVAGNTKEVTRLAVKTNPTPVTSITVAPTELSLGENETAKLTATVQPANATDKTVTWRSEEDGIATVEDHKDGTATVTGVKAGSTNIVATAGGQSVKCKVEVKSNLPEGWNKEAVASVVEEGDRKAPIPKGYTASQIPGEDKISDGLVIYEGADPVTGAKDGEDHQAAMTSRNQYVWIPVDNINKMIMCQTHGASVQLDPDTLQCPDCKSETKLAGKLYATSNRGTNIDITLSTQTYNSGVREPVKIMSYGGITVMELESLQDAFNEMAKSVAKYKGFYIGRYEIQANASSVRGATVLNASKSSANKWYGLYTTIQNSNTPDSTTPQMVWGCQYDQIMMFVDGKPDGTGATFDVKTGSATRKRSSGEVSGNNPADLVCNIYDLQNNYFEYTPESDGAYDITYRGGSYLVTFNAAMRNCEGAANSSDYLTSRASLFVK